MSYIDFQISLGIKDDKKDPEYLSLIKATIEELYTMYGICLYKDLEEYTETVNGSLDTTIPLTYKNLSNVVVKSADEVTTYIEDTDYTLDLANGTIVLLSTGSMLASTDYKVFYDYAIFQNKSNTFEYSFYLDSEKDTYNIYAFPINSINSVTQDSTSWTEDTDYYLYNSKFELGTASVSNYRKPVIMNIDVGYESIPYDLKRAFYDYVQFKFDRVDKKADIISSISSSDGNTTKYNPKIPKHLLNVFKTYSPSPMAICG